MGTARIPGSCLVLALRMTRKSGIHTRWIVSQRSIARLLSFMLVVDVIWAYSSHQVMGNAPARHHTRNLLAVRCRDIVYEGHVATITVTEKVLCRSFCYLPLY